MKKIFLSLLFLFSLAISFAQQRIVRSSDVNTVYDTRLGAIKNFFPPTYADTAEANLSFNIGLDSIGALIFNASTNSYWYRADNPKRWLEVGGAVNFRNSQSVIVTGTGQTSDPYIAQVPVSGEAGNIFRFNPDGAFVPSYIQNGLIEGGFISNVPGSYTYDVMPARYGINGIEFTSLEAQVTLANSDPTFNRIDIIGVNTSGQVITITGTPSANPQEPSYDPLTTLPLRFILVEAATAAPPSVTSEYIYRENVEWTTAPSNATINPASTLNPFSPVLDVEGTNVLSGHLITFTDPTPPTNLTNYIIITFKIRSKGAWPNTSRVEFRFYNGASPVGNVVALSNSTFGFNSGNTTSYQTVTFAIPTFGLITNATALYYTVVHLTGSGHSIGFHLDDIQLQGGPGTGIPVTGRWWSQGGDSWSSLGILGTNDNFNLQLKTNNTFHTQLMTNGSTWMQGVNPGISLFLGTLASGDYFLQRVGTTFTTNSAGAYATKLAGNNIYTYNVTDGHYWYGPAASFAMRLNSSNELEINSGAVDEGDYRLQVTGGVRINATSKNITLIGLPTDNTSTQVAAKDASGNLVWRDVSSISGGAITANNAAFMSSSTNVQFGTNPLIQNTTIPTSAFSLSIQSSNTTNTLAIGNSSSGASIVATNSGSGVSITGSSASSLYSIGGNNTGGGYGVLGVSSTGIGVRGEGVNGVYGLSSTSYGGIFETSPSSTNTVASTLLVSRLTSGTAANGIGGEIDFRTQTTDGVANISGKFKNYWTNASPLVRTSAYAFTLLNSATENDVMTLFGNGGVQLNDYGDGLFSGTPTYLIASDIDGNLIEVSLSSGAISGDNGLTMSTPTNVQLGGSLIQPTTIATGSNTFTISGTSTGINAIISVSQAGTTQYGVSSTTVSGAAFRGFTSGGYAFEGVVNNSGTTTVLDAMRLIRNTSGTAANGIGIGQVFFVEATDGTAYESARINSTLTNATVGTRTGDLQFWTTNSATPSIKATLSGSGAWRYHPYGSGAITGTAAFGLAVDASGNVIEIALGGGGGGTVNSVAGTLNRITSTGGTDPVIDISASYVGQSSITTVGTIATGVWQGSSISTTYTDAKVVSVAGTTNRISIGGTAANPTVDISTSYVGQSSITTLGTIGTGVWQGTSISTSFTDAKVVSVSGTTNRISIGGTAANPTVDISASYIGQSTITTVGTLVSGTAGSGFTIGDVTMNLTGTDATGDIYYRNASGVLTRLPLGSALQVLRVNSGGTGIEYATGGSGSMSSLTLNQPTAGLAISNSGIPITTSAVVNFTLANDLAALEGLTGTGLIRRTGSDTWAIGTTINLSSEVNSTLGVANGGTGLSSLTPGRILVSNTATTFSQVAPTGVNGIVVTMAAGSMSISQNYNHIWQTLTDGATVNWNVSNGANARLTLTGTGRILAMSGMIDGQTYTLRVIQGSGGLKTISTYPAGIKWQNGGTPPDLSDAAGAVDIISFKYEQSTGFIYGTYGYNFQ